MTRYNDEQWDMEGDFDDMLRDMAVISYREGVDTVIKWIEREGLAYAHDICNAIELGEI